MGFFSSGTLPTGGSTGSYSPPPEFYSPGGGGGSSAPAPSGGGTQPPESFDFSGAALGGLAAAAKAPGYVYERPLALLNTLGGGNSDTGQKGPIDQAFDTIRGIPVLGNVLQGVSNVMDFSANAIPSLMNSRTAMDLQSTSGMADNQPILNYDAMRANPVIGAISDVGDILSNINRGGITGAFNSAPYTVGDLRADALRRGFTQQDFTNLANGHASIMDFGHVATNDNRIVDAAGRLILDPMNLLLGTGAITKIAKLPGLLTSVADAAKVAEASGVLSEGTFLGANLTSKAAVSEMLQGASQVASVTKAAGFTAEAAMNSVDAAAAIRSGSAVGATLDGLGTYLKTIGRGVSPYASAYRKAAVGVTVGQLGVSALDMALPDNTPISAPFEGLFQLAHKMQNDTPLSNNGLFSLWSAFHFPVRDVFAGVTTQAKLAYVRRTASDIEPRLVDDLNPGTRQTYQARRTDVIQKAGGQQAWLDAMGHLVGNLAQKAIPEKNALMESGAGSFLGAVAHTENVQDLVVKLSKDALAKGAISGRDVVQELHDWVTGVRGSAEATGGLKFQFTPDLFYQTWQEWTQQAAHLSAVGGRASQVVVGLSKSMLPKEHLTAAQIMFDNVATVGADGHRMVSAADARGVLSHYPQLYHAKYDDQAFFARLLTRDAQPVSLGSIRQRINKLKVEAIPLRSYMYPVEEWENRAQKLSTQRGTALGPDGMPSPTLAPKMGEAVVNVPTAMNTARTNTGFPATTLDHVRELRGTPAVRATENAVPTALDNAGYNVQSVTQGVSALNGTLEPSYAVSLDMARTDPATALQVATQALKAGRKAATTPEHAVVVYVGQDALSQWKLQANGVVVRWDLGGMNAQQVQAVADAMQRAGGHVHLNDTSGALQIAYRNAEYTDQAVSRLDGLASELGRIFPDRAQNGMINPTHDPAWVQIVANDARKGPRNARAISDLAPDATVTSLDRQFATDPRYISAGDSLAASVKSAALGDPSLLAARPGYDATPAEPAGLSAGLANEPVRRISDAVGSGGNEGQVLFLAHADDSLAHLMPKWDPKLEHTLPPEELAKIQDVALDLAVNHPAYELKLTPKHGAPYYPGQGNAVLDVWAGRQAMGDSWTYAVGSKVADFQHALLGKVYSQRLADDGKQALYNELVNAGATAKEVNSFFSALDKQSKTSRIFGKGERQLWQRGDAIPPHTINQIATGLSDSATFTGFSDEVIKNVGAGSFSRLLDRTGSRFYRNLDAKFQGKGRLGGLLDLYYGKGNAHGAVATTGAIVHGASHYIKAFYGIFRFQLDPRWHVMNAAEADMLGYAKYGADATRFAGDLTHADQTAVAIHSGKLKATDASPVEAVLSQDPLASGWRDSRQLDGYIGRAFKVTRQASARDVLTLKAAEDPAIRSALAKFGGTPEEWASGLDQMLYSFDTKGVKNSLMDEARAQLDNEQVRTLAPLIEELYKQNQGNFETITNMYHGNINRSNMERVLNHPLLYWPLSYQLKATKWLFDFATKESFGNKSNLGGAWTLNHIYDQHLERMRTDPGYVQMFEGNPEMWQLAGMILPITPFDLGISASRLTRYTASALGAWLGLWEQDKSYPSDPANMAARVMNLGPTYTNSLLIRAWSQSHDKK